MLPMLLRCAPDYLAYFNITVKPENAWRLLTDSNLDWGQGLIAMRKYEQQHPDETLHLAYFGSVVPQLYGIKAKPLPPEEPVIGKVVVGASCLSGQVFLERDSYGGCGSIRRMGCWIARCWCLIRQRLSRGANLVPPLKGLSFIRPSAEALGFRPWALEVSLSGSKATISD